MDTVVKGQSTLRVEEAEPTTEAILSTLSLLALLLCKRD